MPALSTSFNGSVVTNKFPALTKKEPLDVIYTPFSRQVLKQAFLEFGVKSSKGVDHERPFEL
ncbi:MAG: hypothetical protein OHK0056_06860 [Bacteriovoracaceae bacterium]